MKSYFMTAEDVSKDLGIPLDGALQIIKSLNDILKEDGYTGMAALEGCIHRGYYVQAKEKGFRVRPERYKVPIENRLFWTVDEFVRMSPDFWGKNHADGFLKNIGLLCKNGKKKGVYADAFRKFMDENMKIEYETGGGRHGRKKEDG